MTFTELLGKAWPVIFGATFASVVIFSQSKPGHEQLKVVADWVQVAFVFTFTLLMASEAKKE